MSELGDLKAMLKEHMATTDSFCKAILSEQTSQRQELQRMNFAILGDDKAKIDGLAQKVDKHGKYISRDKKQKWVAFGLLMGGHISLWAYVKSVWGGGI